LEVGSSAPLGPHHNLVPSDVRTTRRYSCGTQTKYGVENYGEGTSPFERVYGDGQSKVSGSRDLLRSETHDALGWSWMKNSNYARNISDDLRSTYFLSASELKTLRDSWNPEWNGSGVWPLISPLLTQINNGECGLIPSSVLMASIEIDEREKACTELSSRFAALPDTPAPNALQEVS
jgi:hypothetical protein